MRIRGAQPSITPPGGFYRLLAFARVIAPMLLVSCLWPDGALAQGAMTNGAVHTGAIASPGQIDTWTFTAAIGDNLNIAIGEVEPTNGFSPWIRLSGPTGTLLGNSANAVADQINNVIAPQTGTYTVLVSSYATVPNGTGGYTLTLAKAPGAFSVSGGDDGGPMVNGANHVGTIALGDFDMWSFTASIGENLNIAIGEVEPTNGFSPWIRLIGPTGTLLGNQANAVADQIANVIAPQTGTYTVLVASYVTVPAGTGGYVLTLAKAPGSITVSPGDQGGALTNGSNHSGTLTLGDIDMWSFSANIGDNINVGIGEVEPTNGLSPWIRLIGPTGTLLGNQANAVADQIANVIAPQTGTYTVLVASYITVPAGTGDYVLTLAKGPGALTISPGDEGGALANGANYAGQVTIGDIDAWTFTAFAGENLNIGIGEVEPTNGLSPWIRLIGPTGALIGNQANAVADQIANVIAPQTGTYTVLVTSYITVPAGTGGYVLTLNKAPSPSTRSAGDQGGPLVPIVANVGEVTLGDIDMWTFFGHAGNRVNVNIGEIEPTVGLSPWIRLISPSGTLIGSDAGAITAQINNVALPVTGTYTVLVSSYATVPAGTGGYNLYVTGIPPQFSDVLIDFGPGVGLYMRQNQGGPAPNWFSVHRTSPSIITTGRLDANLQDDVVVVFPGAGIYAWMNNSAWVLLHGVDATSVVAIDMNNNGVDDVVVSFASFGIWVRYDNGTWARLNGNPATRMAAGRIDNNAQADLVVSFANLGVWAYMNNATWTGLHGASADQILIGNMDGNPVEDVVANFPGSGIWVRYNNADWVRLHTINANGLALGNIDGDVGGRKDLVVSFASYGVYGFLNGSSWVLLHGLSAPRLTTVDLDSNGMDDIVMNFSGYGVWAFMNASTYVQLHWLDAEAVTAGRYDAF